VRIVHVNKFLYRRGGAERYMFDVARALKRRRHDVFFFGTDHPDNVESEYRTYFPPYHDFAGPRVGLRAGLSAIWSRAAAEKFRAFLDDVKPDVAHLHNIAYHLTPSVVAALARAGVPAVMTLHDYNLLCPNHYFYSRDEACFRCVEGRYFSCVTRRCVKGKVGASAVGYLAHLFARRTGAYRKLSRILVPSAFLAEKVRAAGYDDARVVFFPPAIDIRETRAARKGNYFLYAGRLARQKGVDVLIQAAGLAGPKVRLKVAGAGPEEGYLKELAAGFAPDKVEFLGHVGARPLADLMASARAVVVPSRWPENTPAVILEAFAAGAAVVASRIGGMPEMVEDGVEGLLVQAEDVRELAGALELLAGDGRKARKFGEAGRARLARAYPFKEHMARLVDLYREVAA
jgi:glycosyltransferase involved in cell wall biosynthesis